jgi:hypothetical protein
MQGEADTTHPQTEGVAMILADCLCYPLGAAILAIHRGAYLEAADHLERYARSSTHPWANGVPPGCVADGITEARAFSGAAREAMPAALEILEMLDLGQHSYPHATRAARMLREIGEKA